MSDAVLSIRTNASNPDHHPWCNHGTWFIHYTVGEPGRSGQRRRYSLETRRKSVARRRRDSLLRAMKDTPKRPNRVATDALPEESK